MKIIVVLLLILISNFLVANAQDSKGTNKQERKILQLINSLPEVIRENAFRRKNQIKIFLKAYIQTTPTKEQNYYKVSVSEDLGSQLRTYDWYDVNPRSYVIKYEDLITGKSISLKQWREQMRRKHLKNKYQR